jgi:hypothetical protein
MKEHQYNRTCTQADNLIAYLYGESNPSESLAFKKHMSSCPECRTEFDTFGTVLESIEMWRMQALSPATAMPEPFAVVVSVRSAFAALRDFFLLAPVWMRTATAFAGIAMCAFVFLGARHLVESPNIIFETAKGESRFSQQDVDMVVANRVRETQESLTAEFNALLDKDRKLRQTTDVPTLAGLKHQRTPRTSEGGLAMNRDDEKLPSLYALLNESNINNK